MIVNGVLIKEDEFSELCAKRKITNPEWISWIMDVFEKRKKQFILESIDIGVREMNKANEEIERGNKD